MKPMDKLDYKKEAKELYLPKKEPSAIEVPPMLFLMIDGKGDPNEEGGDYQRAIGVLYAITYTIKMSKMRGSAPAGYFEYVAPPLEGLWHFSPAEGENAGRREAGGGEGFILQGRKSQFLWTSMIRQPEFVSEEVFQWACGEVLRSEKKKPQAAAELSRLLAAGAVRLQTFCEGLCVQAMHVGPYDEEPATLARIQAFLAREGYAEDIGAVQEDGTVRRHHEIYLGDPRKTSPEKLKTVLRIPVRGFEPS